MKAQVYITWPGYKIIQLVVDLDETPHAMIKIIQSYNLNYQLSLLFCNGKLIDLDQTLYKQGVRNGDYITIHEYYTYSHHIIQKSYNILSNRGISLSRNTSKNDKFRSIVREALKLKDVAHSNFESMQCSEIMYKKFIQAQGSSPDIANKSIIPDVPISISKEPLPMKFEDSPMMQNISNLKAKTFKTIDQATEYLQEISKEWNW